MNLKLAVAIALIAAPSLARAEALELVCSGTALHTESSTTYASVSADDGGGATGESTTYSRGRSAESMRVRLDGAGGGKLKLPAALVPPISRGKDGWWDFTSLSVTDEKIRGQISLNVLNHPSVIIDRHTGDIDMKGLGMKFSGSCERVPEAAEARKF